jgi:hypothetical protein
MGKRTTADLAAVTDARDPATTGSACSNHSRQTKDRKVLARVKEHMKAGKARFSEGPQGTSPVYVR